VRARRRLLCALLLLAALAAALWLAAGYIDRSGQAFFDRGKGVAASLDRLARALARRDLAAVTELYSAAYSGSPLGLARRELITERDGVRWFRLVAPRGGAGRRQAIAEWQDYLAGFDQVEEVELVVERLRRWRSPSEVVADVRFELIGRPRGAPEAAVDRALLRVRFSRAGGRWQVRGAALLEGERVIAERPQFADVAHAAGVDFENRVYPGFLDRKLAFGMIRYGPAGITAADVDNDGFYDLFIPDGVESKLFRNRGDGTFEDVTAAAGLAGLDGVSVALFADYDNDGRKDLFVSRTFRPNQLFHNDGPGADGRVTFTDVTARSGLGADCCTTVASWGDYDNDGRLDLYVGRYLDPRKTIPTTFYARDGEPNQLYHNEGDGTFTNVTAKAGVGDPGLCLGTAWGDYDDDGWPDLYVANDFGRKTLYHNEHDGTFRDVTVQSGTLAYGAGMSASWGDYDNDGKLDLYVAQIRSDFSWFAAAPTVERYMLNSFRQGVWTSDLPLYLQIFRQSGLGFVRVFQQMASGNTLLRNRGDGTFEDVTWKAKANPPGWFWGTAFADFDNDGWQDLYAADGWVYNDRGTELELGFLNAVVTRQKDYKTGAFFDPKSFGRSSWHGWERNRHLRNNGDGTFLEIGRAAGTDLLLNSRGIAVADFWNRGVLDIAVAASTGRHALLRNGLDAADGRHGWLAVELVGTRSNRDAVGARVTVTAGGRRQVREVALGDGYGAQNSLRLHFGLGAATVADELAVRWPRSGLVQRFPAVAANRIVEVTEGRGRLVEKHYQRGASAGAR
jgi:ASPIC/UnbV protein/VCBS repeat protein